MNEVPKTLIKRMLELFLIDNRDSFTYNLEALVSRASLGLARVRVVDQKALDSMDHLADALIIGPGPGTPRDYAPLLRLLSDLHKSQSDLPVLGVCLGHQAIGYARGASITRANEPLHGVTSPIIHNQDGLFKNVPQTFDAMRYHSLIVSTDNFPPVLHIDAVSGTGEIMALSCKDLPWWGIQFHPESFLTNQGETLLKNFLQLVESRK